MNDALVQMLSGLGGASLRTRAISNLDVLNEAPSYERPSMFSRGLRIDLNGLAVLLISGTGSIDERGQTIHTGDFAAQTRRVLNNIGGLLKSEGATWKDIVRTNCYLRDMDRDYALFNQVRTEFFLEQHLDLYPASTAIETRLCRPDLLIEIDAIAIVETERRAGRE